MATTEEEYPLVLSMIKDVPYAITSRHVQSMTEVPHVIPVPHSPPFVRGLINLRGKIIPLVDLRTRLGIASLMGELKAFTDMLAQREQDHQNWLQELEDSVKEHRSFTLTTDPHKCAFGKWYDNFHTDDHTARHLLRQFDEPHRAIHGVAERVGEYVAGEDFDSAEALIAATRDGELHQMINLFHSTTTHYRESNHEIAMVLETPDFDFAIAVDSVEAVEFLEEGTIQDLPLDNGDEGRSLMCSTLGRRRKEGTIVQILDVDKICNAEDVPDQETVDSLVP